MLGNLFLQAPYYFGRSVWGSVIDNKNIKIPALYFFADSFNLGNEFFNILRFIVGWNGDEEGAQWRTVANFTGWFYASMRD